MNLFRRWVLVAITILYIASVIGFTVTLRLQDDLDVEVKDRLADIQTIARDRCSQVNDVAFALKEAIRIVTANAELSPNLREDLIRLREYGENVELRDCTDLPGVDR